MFCKISSNCQPRPQSQKPKTKGPWADTRISWTLTDLSLTRKQVPFQVLFLFLPVFIFVSISNALESQDKGLVSNDQVPGEADAVLSEGNSLSEEDASSRLARAAASETRKKKNKESRRRRKKASKKRGKKRNNSSMKKGKNTKAGKKRNNSKGKKARKRRKNSKKEKPKRRRSTVQKERIRRRKERKANCQRDRILMETPSQLYVLSAQKL